MQRAILVRLLVYVGIGVLFVMLSLLLGVWIAMVSLPN